MENGNTKIKINIDSIKTTKLLN